MENNEQNLPAIPPQDDVRSLIENLPVALNRSQNTVNKLRERGRALIDTYNAEGMTPELDQAFNDFLVDSRDKKEKMENGRKPTTQILTRVQKCFTSLEAEIDRDRESTLQFQCQKIRDDYAKFCKDEERKKLEAIQLEQDRETEKINLRALMETQLRKAFDDMIDMFTEEITRHFNDMTLDTFDDNKRIIMSWNEVLSRDIFDQFKVNITPRLITKNDFMPIAKSLREQKFPEYVMEYKAAIAMLKRDLSEKFNGKFKTLEEQYHAEQQKREADRLAAIAKSEEDKKIAAENQRIANERAEQLRIEEEKRVNDATERAKQEQLRRETEAQNKIENDKNIATANTVFDKSIETANATVESTASTITGIELELIAPLGILPVMQLWFNEEGSKLTVEQLKKKTIAQMITVCEKLALKGDKRIESPFIKYNETIKAKAVK